MTKSTTTQVDIKDMEQLLSFNNGYLLALEDVRKAAERLALGDLIEELDECEESMRRQSKLILAKIERAVKGR